MSRGRRALKVAGVGVGVAGALYGAARVAAGRGRRGVDPHGDRDFRPPYDSEHTVVSFDRTRLHVVERGEGVPVLLAHGVTNDLRTWIHQIEDLPEAGIRVIAFDQRGHGGSDVGSAGFGVDHLGRDVAAVLEYFDLKDAVLVGHSMGGMGIQAFACAHPEAVRQRVAGLVLVGTSAHALRPWRSLERIPERLLDGGDPWFDRVMLHDDYGYLMTRLGLGRRPLPSHVELVRQMVLGCPIETRRGAIRAIVTYDVRRALGDVGVPTLVVCGTRDLLTPPGAARRIVEALPNAALRLLPGAGHMPMLEQADAVTSLITEFVAELGAVEVIRPASAPGVS